MSLNVNEKDLGIEREVMDKVSKLYEPFSGIAMKQNDGDTTAIFDFYGYDMLTHKISVDVKALYNEPFKYANNIISIDKWKEFIKNQPRVYHFIVYYYPEHKFVRIYDLAKCNKAKRGIAKIVHKRTKEVREDDVVYIPLENADKEINL